MDQDWALNISFPLREINFFLLLTAASNTERGEGERKGKGGILDYYVKVC